jgi:uracil-DNA glycosylase family 4
MPPESEHILETENFWAEAEALGRSLSACLDYYRVLGLEGLPVQLSPPEPARSLEAPARTSGESSDMGTQAPARWAPAARDLPHLAELTARCRACPRGRTRSGDPAFGRGSAQPLLVLVGLDPGLYDGPEADLLAAILEKGLKLDPAGFYVTSILKCPAGPGESPAELAEALSACLAVTFRELALLAPRVVLALGEAPGRGLTGQPKTPLGLLRHRAFRLEDPPEAWLRVTFSLEQMLAAPDIKREAWKTDFLTTKKVLDN